MAICPIIVHFSTWRARSMYDVACEFVRAAVRSKDAQKQLARTPLSARPPCSSNILCLSLLFLAVKAANLECACLLKPSVWFPEEHRAATTLLQRTRFCEVHLSYAHVVLMAFTSASVLLRQVCFGLPPFRFPCGFQSKACLVTFEGDFLSVWPIHPHFLFLIFTSMGL